MGIKGTELCGDNIGFEGIVAPEGGVGAADNDKTSCIGRGGDRRASNSDTPPA